MNARNSPAFFQLSIPRQFAPFLCHIGTPAFRRKVIEWTPIEVVQRLKHMSDVMYEKASDILYTKRSAIVSQAEVSDTSNRDLISILRKHQASVT